MGRIPDGRGMAFEPRSVVQERKAFGRVRGPLTPAEGVHYDDHRYRAAMTQHHLACAVHDGLLRAGVSLPVFLLSWDYFPGLSADRQRRMLRGETMAQFADIAFWADRFPDVAGTVADYINSWHQMSSLKSPGNGVATTVLTHSSPGV